MPRQSKRPDDDEERGDIAASAAASQPASLVAARFTQLSGPIPSPEILGAYNVVEPGLANRIVQMAEDEAAQRRLLEKVIVEAQVGDLRAKRSEIRMGQICAAAIAVVGLGVSGWVTVGGHGAAGTVLGGGTLATMVTAFLYKRSERPSPETALPAATSTHDRTQPEPPTIGSMSRPTGER